MKITSLEEEDTHSGIYSKYVKNNSIIINLKS